MTYYVGKSLDNYNKKAERYFYGLKRDDDTGFLIVDKVNLDSSTDTLEIVDLKKTTGALPPYMGLEEGVDFFEGRTTPAHTLAYDGLNYEQYRWSEDNLYYYIDGEGQLTVRINQPYNYPEGVTTLARPQDVFRGNPITFGGIGTGNPLENQNLLDLGSVTDLEAASLAYDMGSIT